MATLSRIPFRKLTLLLGLLLLPSLPAQQAEEPTVSLNLRFFPIHRQNIPNLFLQTSPGTFEPVTLRNRLRSDPHEYEGPPRVVLFHRHEGPEDGEEFFTPATAVTVNQSSGDVLIFLMPPGIGGGINRDDWTIIAIDDRVESFPNGTMRVLNATGVNLSGFVGEQPISLGYAVSAPFVPPRPRRADLNAPLPVMFALDLEPGHELVFANTLQIPDDGRSILVLRPPRRTRSIQIDTFLLEEPTRGFTRLESEAEEAAANGAAPPPTSD